MSILFVNCYSLQTLKTNDHCLALVYINFVQYLQVPLSGRESHRINVVAVDFQQQGPFYEEPVTNRLPSLVWKRQLATPKIWWACQSSLAQAGVRNTPILLLRSKVEGPLSSWIVYSLPSAGLTAYMKLLQLTGQSKLKNCYPLSINFHYQQKTIERQFELIVSIWNINIRFIMKNIINLEKLEELPLSIRKLVPKPEINKVPFDSLNDTNIEKAVNYVKTKTVSDLLISPSIEEREIKVHDNPIILVFCQPSEELNIQKNTVFPYTPISYTNWLEAAGAHCIPLPYNINEGSMQFLFQRSHGLLIPGGAANLYKSYQNKEGYGPMTVGFLKMWRCIQKMWGKGINYPIWGTCLGLQVMLIAISNDIKILSNLNHRGYQAEIYSDYENSTILGNMPLDLRLNVQNRKLLNFYHMHGITVKKFLSTPKLTEKLKIISISKDKDQKWFCSLIEGKEKPIFLSQFHSQKQAFQWTKKGDIISNKYSIQVSQFIAQNFVKQCTKCKSEKAFMSIKELQFYTFQQYRQIFTPEKHYRVYVIDFKYREYDREQKKKISEKQITISSKRIYL